MDHYRHLEKYTFGVGDRFGRQATAQLRAFLLMAETGVEVIPVWNKSNREHLIIGSQPESVRVAAETAVRELAWQKPYHVDADHIRLDTVNRFVPHSDFFTIDVADSIGRPASPSAITDFLDKHPELCAPLDVPGISQQLDLNRATASAIASKYLEAIRDAGEIYRHILDAKQGCPFATEVSMDETDAPQKPPELLIILAALADQGVPCQTIAPKFTGRFNKGVDYVGDVAQFEQEFNDDLAVLAYAVSRYCLPKTLKLSVHSGSDKFSLYPVIRRALRASGAGLHLKTAGTSWLEELIGLAEAGAEGLAVAKRIYAGALDHQHELCKPYASVIQIDTTALPSAKQVESWSGREYVAALRHDPKCHEFNPSFRQLLHVGYKIAAQLGTEYLDALERFRTDISRNVTFNLFERHMKPLFLG